MKVKMADVAKRLGISKATVSLAINQKPGVNEETRKRIFQCIKEMEESRNVTEEDPEKRDGEEIKKLIKVVFINHQKKIISDPELELWSGVLETFDAEARKRGYLYGLSYLNEEKAQRDAIIDECNLQLVAGVIIFGTEMEETDYDILARIQKPLVVYDHEVPDGRFSSVCIDNKGAVEQALGVLRHAGAEDIVYLSTGKEIYNFQKRREAFREAWRNCGTGAPEDRMVALGGTIQEIAENASAWMDREHIPDAFLSENYQVSIGVLKALRRRNSSASNQVRITGIDEVPEYMIPGGELTCIKIPHQERAALSMMLLDMQIRMYPRMKIKIFAETEVIQRKSG